MDISNDRLEPILETLAARRKESVAQMLDVLRDVYVRGKYRDVILPMTVIRRLDAVLEPTKKAVLAEREARKKAGLNPEPFLLKKEKAAFKRLDKVMQTKNDYDKQVFNGDLGIVEDYHARDKLLLVNFDGWVVEYGADELDELTLSYAVSVHKSQGSEYPCHFPVAHPELSHAAEESDLHGHHAETGTRAAPERVLAGGGGARLRRDRVHLRGGRAARRDYEGN